MGCPASSAARMPSAFTGARRKTSSPTAAAIAFNTAEQPEATGGSPIPGTDRCLRIGKLDRRPLHVPRHVENRRRFVLIEPARRAPRRISDRRPTSDRWRDRCPRMDRPSIWPPERRRVDDRAHVCDAHEIDDLIHAGLDVHLDFCERRARTTCVLPLRVYVSRATPISPCPASAVADRFVKALMSFGSFVAVEDAAELDRALRGLRERHACAAAFPRYTLVGHDVVFGPAAQILRRDLLQLLDRVARRCVRGARRAHESSGCRPTRSSTADSSTCRPRSSRPSPTACPSSRRQRAGSPRTIRCRGCPRRSGCTYGRPA